jgi:hypothetical protein
MHDATAGATLYLALWPAGNDRQPAGAIHIVPGEGREPGMERTEWLNLNPPDARFLMLTAITHHTFSSPAWGEHEVRKLHAELAEPDRLAAQAVIDHDVARSRARRTIRPFL